MKGCEILKKIIVIFLLILGFSFHTNTYAKSFNSLPISKSSNQWSVKIDQADQDQVNEPELTKAKKGVFNVYSLDISNIGDRSINNVRIEAYRNEPHSKTYYELFTHEGDILIKDGSSYHHANFPISVKAKVFKVDITWEKTIKGNQIRHFKETFIFHQK